ncbi:MAG: carbohydrate kinase [Candidatus Eiseniibacteriota bacterium]|jgi:fructokinase
MAKVLTIGELLWDRMTDGDHLGGAPANVAFHLSQAGHQALLLSAVGDDAAGHRAMRQLAESGVDVTRITVDPRHPTGVVDVELDANGVPTFDIRRDVAWDHIPQPSDLDALLESTDAVVFGTLAQRQATSHATIDAVLGAGNQMPRIVDLNLRAPFYDRDVVRRSLERATILKLSDGELDLLPGLVGPEFTGGAPPLSAEALSGLAARFDLERIYVTRGAEGCDVHAGGELHHVPATPIQVADTVGAGDAFTAALVDGELRCLPPATIAAHAAAAGAFVASQPGAMPRWSETLLAEVRAGS